MRVVLMILAGCGSAGKDTDAGTGGNYPEATSAGIAAWVADESYQGAGWTAETDAPRPRNSEVSPHGDVRVWFNDELVASQAAGNGEFQGTAHDPGSMAVKEMFEADTLVGVAVMLKIDGDAEQWAYWCDGPADLCGVTSAPTDPYFGVAREAECAFCHGGLVFNEL